MHEQSGAFENAGTYAPFFDALRTAAFETERKRIRGCLCSAYFNRN